jgi:hypothetical protein
MTQTAISNAPEQAGAHAFKQDRLAQRRYLWQNNGNGDRLSMRHSAR